MKQPLYIFSNALLRRKDSTLVYTPLLAGPEEGEPSPLQEECILLGAEPDSPAGGRVVYPVESVSSVYAFAPVRFNAVFLGFLASRGIPLHVFSYHGKYYGSFLPPKGTPSGTILRCQYRHAANPSLRLHLAGKFVAGSAANLLANLAYYRNRGAEVTEEINTIETLLATVPLVGSVEALMGVEGSIKREYFNALRHIIKPPFRFIRRQRNPPPDPVNALISYTNMVVYAFVLNELWHTRLYPEIGYLHSCGDHRLPLCYDLAEIFKPVIADRLVFKLINKGMVNENDFTITGGACVINKSARKLILKELDEKMNTVIGIKKESARMSYRRVIRQECRNLTAMLAGGSNYTPYKSQW